MVSNLLAPDDPHAVVAIETTAARRLGHDPETKPCPFVLTGLPQILATVAIIKPGEG